MSSKNSFVTKLNKPYYFEINAGSRWLTALKFGIFVFLFLFIFKPFGLSNVPVGITSVALGYALITFVVMLMLNIAAMPLLPRFFSEERWNVARELYWNMLNVLVIGFGNAIYSASIGISDFSPYSILMFELYTISIAIIPISITVLFKESQRSDKFKQASNELNHRIEEQTKENKTNTQNSSLLISSGNEKDKLQVLLSDLLFVQSSDNYVEVHYLEKGHATKKLMRISLKAVELQLESNSDIFRCHKSYMVNLKKVNHVSGNAQGYKLKLEHTNKPIPVSRPNNDELKKRLGKN
jgi:hypothetical protein